MLGVIPCYINKGKRLALLLVVRIPILLCGIVTLLLFTRAPRDLNDTS